MSWVRPELPYTPANAQLCDAGMVVVSQELDMKYHTNRVVNQRPVVYKSITLSARPNIFCNIV